MSATQQAKMTVDEFLVWAEQQEGRYELFNGVAYLMAPERARHGQVKFKTQLALQRAIRERGLPCHMLPDGATVRVSKTTAHEPDAIQDGIIRLDPPGIEISVAELFEPL